MYDKEVEGETKDKKGPEMENNKGTDKGEVVLLQAVDFEWFLRASAQAGWVGHTKDSLD